MKEKVKKTMHRLRVLSRPLYWETTIIYNFNLNQKCDIQQSNDYSPHK